MEKRGWHLSYVELRGEAVLGSHIIRSLLCFLLSCMVAIECARMICCPPLPPPRPRPRPQDTTHSPRVEDGHRRSRFLSRTWQRFRHRDTDGTCRREQDNAICLRDHTCNVASMLPPRIRLTWIPYHHLN